MAWKCPKGCHLDDDHEVCQVEFRSITIAHSYKGDDGSLEHELGEEICIDREATVGVVQCNTCQSKVTWESEIPPHK